MLKKLIVTAIGVALLVGAILYAKLGQFSAMGEAAENMTLPPETVTAMTVNEAQWEQVIAATATVSAVQGVTIGAELGGRVSEILFQPGAVVEQGEVLLRLDTSSEAAQLASAEATASLAQSDLKRVKQLGERDLTSKDSLDQADAEAKATVARVDEIRALIDKKTVRAPFSGRLGLRLVNLGQILQEGDAIVSLYTLNPIYVDFSVPQQQIMHLRQDMLVRVSSDIALEESFDGRIVAVNPEVDAATRNVRVRALVDNPEEKLRPGMFANVQVVLPDKKKVLPIAATSVLYAPYGDSVFVIENQKNEQSGETEQVLRQQFVRLGQTRGDFVDVTDGLKPGESIVTSGVFKLRTGMKVVIDNTLAPEPKLEPNPQDS